MWQGPVPWGQTYLSLRSCCVTLDELLNLSESRFCHL